MRSFYDEESEAEKYVDEAGDVENEHEEAPELVESVQLAAGKVELAEKGVHDVANVLVVYFLRVLRKEKRVLSQLADPQVHVHADDSENAEKAHDERSGVVQPDDEDGHPDYADGVQCLQLGQVAVDEKRAPRPDQADGEQVVHSQSQHELLPHQLHHELRHHQVI